MKEIPKRPKQHSGSALDSRAAEVLQRQESDSASSREKLEDTLGGALTRVLSRAGLSVRVVPSAQGAATAEESSRSHPPASAPSAGSYPASAAAVEYLPARDELITLFTIVLAGKVLGQLPAGALIETVAASEPAAPETADSGLGSQPVQPVVPPAAIPWKALPSPPVTGPTPPKPAPARPAPVTAAPAPASAASKPTAPPVKGRGFTIRY